jgi:hypothetical protein
MDGFKKEQGTGADLRKLAHNYMIRSNLYENNAKNINLRILQI